MTFRRRIVVASAVAVAVAVALASVAVWFVVRDQLRDDVDEDLLERAALIARGPTPGPGPLEDPRLVPGERVVLFQVRTPDGRILRGGTAPLDIPLEPRPYVAGFEDRDVAGAHLRVYHQPLGGGFLLSVAVPLTEVDESLRRLAFILALLTAGGVALAVALGSGVMTTAIAPVRRLTEATERVTETGDLSLRLEEPSGDADELGRLAASFNAMLAALGDSVGAQRRLVADASHELRTPITSIRTNLDLLASGATLDAGDRERLLDDVRVQLEELTDLVNDLVELARDGERELALADVRLDAVTVEAVERARRRARDVRLDVDVTPTVVRGDALRLARAIGNMLDNAVKWSPAGTAVDVTVRDGVVVVCDLGPGFEEGDLPHVFDRFYRAASARSMPGSGLGLAIVRQVAEAHGGRAVAENAPDGGARVRIEVPVAEVLPAPPP